MQFRDSFRGWNEEDLKNEKNEIGKRSKEKERKSVPTVPCLWMLPRLCPGWPWLPVLGFASPLHADADVDI